MWTWGWLTNLIGPHKRMMICDYKAMRNKYISFAMDGAIGQNKKRDLSFDDKLDIYIDWYGDMR